MSREKAFFVSDLHLFTRRSLAHDHAEALAAAAAQARLFVLGGDIFDFRWTTLATVDHTIDAAIDWLVRLMSPHPECQFHFLLGNHDSHAEFTRRLELLAQATPNLAWHPYYLRLGESLFLHGDCADWRMNHATLMRRRSRAHAETKRGPMANMLYDAAIAARLHRLASRVAHRRRTIAGRVHAYARDIGHGPDTGLRHVYFGHTHAAMSYYEHDGLLFHNGGAPLRGLEFSIVEAVAPPRAGRLAGAG